jgi:CheY-like chemotaxis protein
MNHARRRPVKGRHIFPETGFAGSLRQQSHFAPWPSCFAVVAIFLVRRRKKTQVLLSRGFPAPLARHSLKLAHDGQEVLIMKTKLAPANAPENVKLARPATSRILVVDDDASVREMLTRVLIGEGYLVWSAAEGAHALEIAGSQKIDLVLLDLNLAGENGWDTFEQLTMENPLMAVIIITARSNQLFTALGAGVGALLEKPLNFAKLLETIHRLLAEPMDSRRARAAGGPADLEHRHGHPVERKKQKT